MKIRLVEGLLQCIPFKCMYNDCDPIFHPHMWITNYGNLRMRGFGVIATAIPSLAPNK